VKYVPPILHIWACLFQTVRNEIHKWEDGKNMARHLWKITLQYILVVNWSSHGRLFFKTQLFLANSRLTTSVYWPCYCTIHVYVVIHFCDSMWSFCVQTNLCRFVIVRLYIYCHWRFQLSREECWEPVNRFIPATFSVCLKPGPGFQTKYAMDFLCLVSSVKMGGDSWFCWYWWDFFKIHGQSPLDIGQVIIQIFVLAMYI
jgi:hypothetical protein